MRIYLCAGFGHRLGANLTQIRALGFDGVRQDLPPGQELELIREFAPGNPGAGLRPLFLINGGKMLEDPEPAGARASQVALLMHELGVAGEIEIGNEPNIARDRYRNEPQEIAHSVVTAYRILERDRRLRDTRLIMGGVSNTDRKALDYLDAALVAVPTLVHVGFHTYRTTQTPDKPAKGFSTRQAEFHRLQAIANGRQLWNTEIGWHDAPSKVGCWPFKRTVQFSEGQVLNNLFNEAAYNFNGGAEVMTVFQFNDGPGEHYESHFGIRRLDETLKASAYIAKEWNG